MLTMLILLDNDDDDDDDDEVEKGEQLTELDTTDVETSTEILYKTTTATQCSIFIKIQSSAVCCNSRV